jgi:hypothetical protein
VIVMLLPANRTEQGWWQEGIEAKRHDSRLILRFLPGRLRFLKPGADAIKPNERPPFGCVLLIWQKRSGFEPEAPEPDKQETPWMRAPPQTRRR